MIKEGAKAPAFELPADDGTTVALKDLIKLDPLGISGIFLDRLGGQRVPLAVDWTSGRYLSRDHRLLLIDGVPPEAVEYGSTLPPLVTVWIAARAGMRAVFERTTIAAIIDGQLPDAVLALAADVHAWDPPR